MVSYVMETDNKTIAEDIRGTKGELFGNLTRNNKDIRADRAQIIIEDAFIAYKREIEDIETTIRKIRIELSAMMDLSPDRTTKMSFNEFDGKAFATKRLDLIKNLRINTLVANELKVDFEHVFGETYKG